VKVSDLAGAENDRDMPLSYCFCCAGSYRRHLQLRLGVELKTREIVSSPINSGGEKPCVIIFETAMGIMAAQRKKHETKEAL